MADMYHVVRKFVRNGEKFQPGEVVEMTHDEAVEVGLGTRVELVPEEQLEPITFPAKKAPAKKKPGPKATYDEDI